MISLKCKNCGGEMSVDGSGNLYCGYCGTKSAFRDDELIQYKNFRLQVLNYLRGVHDKKADGKSNEELLWNNAEVLRLKTKDGTDVTLNYVYFIELDEVSIYLTRGSVVYVFPKNQRGRADDMLRGLSMLDFPAADVKNLNECFPKFTGRYELEEDGVLLTFERPDNLFPLSMFGSLEPKLVAWITSRLENMCCVFEYSGIIQRGITEEAVFINPFTHHAVLFGRWWNVVRKASLRDCIGDDDLRALRQVAKRVMGTHESEAPEEFIRFLKEDPAGNAYQDFERWDRVIEEGFGGRHFTKMSVDFE